MNRLDCCFRGKNTADSKYPSHNIILEGTCYRLNVCIPLNSYTEALAPNVIVFGCEAFGRELGLDEGGALMMRLVHVDYRNLASSPPLYHMRISKVVIYKPGTELSPGTSSVEILILDFQPQNCKK